MILRIIPTPEDDPKFESTLSYLVTDNKNGNWLLKWTNGRGGYAIDEYNAWVLGRWLTLGKLELPEITVLTIRDLWMNDLISNLNDVVENKREWALGRLNSKVSSTPVLVRWYDALPMWHEAKDDIDMYGEHFIMRSPWHAIGLSKALIYDCVIVNHDRGGYEERKNILVNQANQTLMFIDNQYSIQRSGEIMMEEAEELGVPVKERIKDYANIRAYMIYQTVANAPSLSIMAEKVKFLRFKEVRKNLLSQMVVSSPKAMKVYMAYLEELGKVYYKSYGQQEWYQ